VIILAPLPAGGRVQNAGITGLVVIDSEILMWLESEGALAAFLGRRLAPLVLRHHEEELSHRQFLYFAPVPAVPLMITSVVKRQLLLLAIPYAAIYAAAWWYFRKLHLNFENEGNYVGLRLARQNGHDLNEHTRYLEKTTNDNERRLHEQLRLLTVGHGPNLPAQV
jgi:hypothetical protein